MGRELKRVSMDFDYPIGQLWRGYIIPYSTMQCNVCDQKGEILDSGGTYVECAFCDGEGELYATDEIQRLAEAWQPFDPPAGEGFQLWSTTSEGHPMTPVFPSLEELCTHLEEKRVSKFGRITASKEEWLQMLTDGLVSHTEGNFIFI